MCYIWPAVHSAGVQELCRLLCAAYPLLRFLQEFPARITRSWLPFRRRRSRAPAGPRATTLMSPPGVRWVPDGHTLTSLTLTSLTLTSYYDTDTKPLISIRYYSKSQQTGRLLSSQILVYDDNRLFFNVFVLVKLVILLSVHRINVQLIEAYLCPNILCMAEIKGQSLDTGRGCEQQFQTVYFK